MPVLTKTIRRRRRRNRKRNDVDEKMMLMIMKMMMRRRKRKRRKRERGDREGKESSYLRRTYICAVTKVTIFSVRLLSETRKKQI